MHELRKLTQDLDNTVSNVNELVSKLEETFKMWKNSVKRLKHQKKIITRIGQWWCTPLVRTLGRQADLSELEANLTVEIKVVSYCKVIK